MLSKWPGQGPLARRQLARGQAGTGRGLLDSQQHSPTPPRVSEGGGQSPAVVLAHLPRAGVEGKLTACRMPWGPVAWAQDINPRGRQASGQGAGSRADQTLGFSPQLARTTPVQPEGPQLPEAGLALPPLPGPALLTQEGAPQAAQPTASARASPGVWRLPCRVPVGPARARIHLMTL